MPLVKLKYRKYPHLAETMARRHTVYNDTLAYVEEKEKSGQLFVIRPEHKLDVSRMERNPDKLEKAYKLGRQAAENKLSKIQRFLNNGKSENV